MPEYYPVYLNLAGKRCVILGGGTIAQGKLAALRDAGADITLISPQCTEGIKRAAQRGQITLIQREYRPGDLEDAFIAVAATNVWHVNRQIYEEAEKRGVLLNVVDDPELCMFTAPSLLKRGDLTVAISTNGRSPAMARKVREDLEERFPKNYGDLVTAAAEARDALREEGRQIAGEVWNAALGPVIDQFAGDGKGDEARRKLLQLLRGEGDTEHKERS